MKIRNSKFEIRNIFNLRKVLIGAGVYFVFGLGQLAASSISSTTILLGSNPIFTAGVTTNTVSTVIFINTFGDNLSIPDAGETVTVQLLDNGSAVSDGMTPTSFTTTGTGIINGGNTPLPITFYRAGTTLQIRAISAIRGATKDSATFTVVASSATKLLVLGPGMTHAPGTNPSTTNGLSGTFTPQEPNQAFLITVILTDNQFNKVSANHTVSFASGDLVTLPSPGSLSGGTAEFNVTMTGARITRTITVSDVTDTSVSAGSLEVTTAGPAAKEVFPFPSPFNPLERDVTFRFRLSEPKGIRVLVTDLFGQSIWERSVSGNLGFNDLTWNGRNDQGHVVAAGVYYVLLEVDGSIQSRKKFGVVK